MSWRCEGCDTVYGDEQDLCPVCRIKIDHDEYDADELGLDPEEEFDA